MSLSYDDFIASKTISDKPSGFEPPELNPMLFDFQQAIVKWALRRGRAAIFADCGLGKTPIQLEWASHVHNETKENILILAPLAVSQQTVREGVKFNVDVNICRDQSDVAKGINITNYEMLHKFDASKFSGIVLDESSILKSYTGKYRNMLIESFTNTPYKLCCTATPAPNDFMELGNHSEFLGVMRRQEMLAMFFYNDGKSTQKWHVKGHALDVYWKWVASWAVYLRMPSDLGYENNDFLLPEKRTHEIRLEVYQASPGMLFAVEALTLQERLRARAASINERVAACANLINNSSDTWIIWCNLNAESDALGKAISGAVTIKGSDKNEHKEKSMLEFSEGKIRVLVTKPTIAGHGMNWQHCNKVAFVGLSDSWEQYYQAVRRCWRFMQKNTVDVYIIIAETEGAVMTNIQRKEKDAKTMADNMIENMSEISKENIKGLERETAEYKYDLRVGENWELHLGDCVKVAGEIEADSIDYSIFSPPFASLYTYSNSENDMGNCKNHDEFAEHFEYLIVELMRIIKPGRLVSFHCMNLPTLKFRDGHIGIRDFRGKLIRMFQKHGWIYHSEVCIWKDPVTAMQRTKALGLLHKQIKKDASRCRQGIPDYVVTMRKPGENPNPVTNTNETFPVSKWQKWASPIWTDIKQNDTLQKYRDEKDEKHICPLQLGVIERCISLWTNEYDLILSPFAGIGSEGYKAVLMGRRFIGIELKEIYYNQAIVNLKMAEAKKKELTLF